MRSTIAGTLAITLALTACDIPIKKAPPADQGLGAGATPAATTPAPPPVAVVDSPATQPATQPNTSAKKPAKVTDQTQSGVTDKSGSSTLGSNIRKARPDQDQPVTAKGDVVVARWDSAAGGWTYHKLGDTVAIATPGAMKGDTAFNQGNGAPVAVPVPTDSIGAVRAPGTLKGDSAFNQQKGDSLKPVAPPATPPIKVDSILGPMKGDTALKRPLQGNDTMPAPKDSTTPKP